MKKTAGSVFLILGMVVSWTVFYTISKILVDRTGSAVLSGALIRAAALVFLTIQIVSTGKIRLLFRQGKAVPILLLVGVFGFLLDLFANLGYRYGSLSTGTALLKTDVLMVNLASVVIYRKKLRALDWLATFLMLAGVFLVLEIDFKALSFRATDLFFLLSAAAVSANAFLIKHLQEKRSVDADVISYYNNFVVLTLFSLAAGISGDFRRLPGLVSGWFLPLVLIGGLAQTGIYYFYYRSLKRFEVWQVKLYLLTMPIFSAVSGIVFLNEKLSLRKAAGILIVLAGAALVVLGTRLGSKAKEHHQGESS